ncbi:MAG TPA: ABC transporter permease [Verrucomicrobiae bacterium]
MFFRQFKNELWKLFGKRRTCLGFIVLLLAQLIIVALLRLSPTARQGLAHSLQLYGSDATDYSSMLTVATLMSSLLGYSLVPLFTALVGGDLMSKEAEDGTLRLVLARPVSRERLILLKFLAGAVFSCLLLLTLALGGLGLAAVAFPATGDMVAQLPDQAPSCLPFSTGLWRYSLAHVVMLAKALTIFSLALMFSCCHFKPAAAAILALTLFTIDRILMEMPFFHELKHCFLGHYLNCWQLVFLQPIPWGQLGNALALLGGLSLLFVAAGAFLFHKRDVKL